MIGAIEEAIVKRIRDASDAGALGYRLLEVTSYGGQLDEEIHTVVKRFPSIWVTYAGDDREPERIGTEEWRFHPLFTVIVAARNYRNEQATRHGDGDGVGSYQLLGDVRALLIGRTLGLEIEALSPGQAVSLFGGQAQRQRMSIFAQPFRTSFEAAAGADGDIADFATFHADWDIPASEGHTAVPLDDGQADATDTVRLETD